MKKLLFLIALLASSSFNSTSYAQKIKIPCPTTLNDINDCPDTGCGNVDPHLNRQKNIRSLDGAFAEPKTSRSRRTIPLPASTVKALIEHRRQQGIDRLRIGSDWQDHGLVFPTSIGTPYTLSSLTNKWFKPALVTAELTGFNLYSLRHTHATLLLANGENAKVASERLGHSTVVLTLDTYSHVLPDMQQQAAERIESLLFKTG